MSQLGCVDGKGVMSRVFWSFGCELVISLLPLRVMLEADSGDPVSKVRLLVSMRFYLLGLTKLLDTVPMIILACSTYGLWFV
jgi:hypothetical protein